MSRRKQANPQHLKSDEEGTRSGSSPDNELLRKRGDDSGSESHSGSEETHVCQRCCAEFFEWSELLEHQRKCTEEPAVLIVQEDEGFPAPQGSPTESLLSAQSDLAEKENMEQDSELVEKSEINLSGPEDTNAVGADEPMETNAPVDKTSDPSISSLPSGPSDNTTSLSSLSTIYGMPSTNVTLEILHSTRVAVAQFSQSIPGDGSGGKVSSVAIPMILEQLMALQQQQVHQLQLIEQIRSQVAVMNRQPTQAALNPASKGLASVSSTYHLQGMTPPPVLPLSGVIPCTVKEKTSVTHTSVLEGPPFLPSQSSSRQSMAKGTDGTSVSLTNPKPPLSTCTETSSQMPSCNGDLSSASHTLTSPGTLSATPSANLPLLPQSPPSGVIFPNPLASIAATTNALDPLAAMMKHRKGKMPSVSIFDTKSNSEDPFFKHKCRFCAKVFGSDSALQIHLRSHTGERPFKCNICGNRFSTKGNLKVHFQRHKEKYPHVQMNPYPVPEYLDNIPTSSGIPYGMSLPPEKAGSTWLDNKPVLPTLPAMVGRQLPLTVSSAENFRDSFKNVPLGRFPKRTSPARNESGSLSPKATGPEPDIYNQSDSKASGPKMTVPQSNKGDETILVSKVEDFHQTTNSMTRQAENYLSVNYNISPKSISSEIHTTRNTPETTNMASLEMNSSTPPLNSDQFKSRFPLGGIPDTDHTSETSKLQQLVENIDKKMMDPNQCVICHRVLSCQSALKMHYRIHTGERPFKCKVCGRAFTTKGNLKTHCGVHRAKPPLQVQHSCPICQKKFTNAVVLQQHIRMHMGGQIPNNLQTLPPDTILEKHTDLTFDDKSFDSMNDYEDDSLDDISYEEEGDIAENGENPFNSFSDSSSPISPLPSAVSEMTTASDSAVSLRHFTGHRSVMSDFLDNDHPNNGSSSVGDLERPLMPEPPISLHRPLTPSETQPECHHDVPPLLITSDTQERAAAIKCEMSESPVLNVMNGAVLDQMGKTSVKKESSFNVQYFGKEHGVSQRSSDMTANNIQASVKMEVEGYSRSYGVKEGPFFPFGSIQSSPRSTEATIPGITSLLGNPPPRRTPKQHNCNVCGKNFSSASALQIHERTHTGEKPFACSVCGRAFTTKGNLKVHMGTHMWNNTPARRGKRLSVENPLALLGGEALKFSEVLQKDLAARAVDQNFWSRYAAAISNGLAMKNNEISVIQNGGLAQLPAVTMALDKASTGNNPPITTLGKTNIDLGTGRHFSMLIDENKEIRIN